MDLSKFPPGLDWKAFVAEYKSVKPKAKFPEIDKAWKEYNPSARDDTTSSTNKKKGNPFSLLDPDAQ